MIYLALEEGTNDLFKPVGGGVARTEEGRFIVQQVRSKLQTWLDEWALDPGIGWLSITDYEKNFDIFDIETRARVVILGTQGVKSISSLDSTYSSRTLTITFKAQTIYGEIDLTVPWNLP